MASVNFGADVYVDGDLEIDDDLTVGGQIVSLVDSIAPFVVTSTMLNENLNADLLDGEHGAYYLDLANATGVLGVAYGGTGLSTVGSAGQLLRSTGTGLEYFTHDFISSTLLGAVNGVATLDATGKVPLVQLPTMGMQYKGTWNASTNTPTLSDGTGNEGEFYRVVVGGIVDLGSGSIEFKVGDDVIHNGIRWELAPAGSVTPDLQAVTDQGATTTNNITVYNSGGGAIQVMNSDDGSYVVHAVVPTASAIAGYHTAHSFVISADSLSENVYLRFLNNTTSDDWNLEYSSGLSATLGAGNQLRVQQDPVHDNDLARKLYIDTGLSTKFDIPTGSTSQYIRGDGSLATFPSIPTVGNGTLTLAVGTGLTGSATFTANQSGNSTFTVGLGTNLSNLNALSTSGFVKKTGANTWSIDTTTYMAASNAYTKTESDAAYVKKTGDTMTGTLNGTRIILNDQFEVVNPTAPNHKIHLVATPDYTRLNMGYGSHTTFQIHVVENGTSYFVHNIGDGSEQRMIWDSSKNITFNVANRIQVNGDVRYTGQLVSTVANGTSPLQVTSSTLVTNLNADFLDGQHGSYYLSLSNATGVLPVAKGGTGLNTIGTAGQMLRSTGTALEFFTPSYPTGTGTAGYIPKWGTSSSLNDSAIYQDGSGRIGIGTTSMDVKLVVNGGFAVYGNSAIRPDGDGNGIFNVWRDIVVGDTVNDVHGTVFIHDGIGTPLKNSNAAFEVKSTTKGVLFPRMTAAQRDAIAGPAGMVVYNTTTNAISMHNGTSWIDLASSSFPTNYVTTNTNQSSLGGNKAWTGSHSWALSSNVTPSVVASSIAVGKATSGIYLISYDNDANQAFALRTFAASGGYQLTLDKGGVETPTHGNSSQWNAAWNWVNTYGSGLQSGPYVKLTGDTMSGSLTISGDGNGLYLHQGAAVYKRVGGGLTLKRHNDAAEVSIENAAGDQRYPIWSDAYSMWRGGTTLYSSGDLSDIGLVGGAYYAQENVSDKPGGVNSYILHIPHHNNSGYWMQIGSPYLYDTKLYVRKHLPSGAENWIPLAYESWVSSNFVPQSRTISAGTGLTGGGNLTADRTISVNFGTTAGTVAQGNDSRINNGQTAYGWGNHASAGYVPGTRTLQFTAGSGLSVSGTASTNLSVDRTVTYSLTFGTTAGTVAQGNDSRIVNAVQTSRSINTQHSITGGGNLGSDRTFQLVNDVPSPGANKYYGTNNANVRGWYDLPSTSSFVPNTRTITINGVTHDLSTNRSWTINAITGSGTVWTVPLWSSSSGISNSIMIQDAGVIKIGGGLEVDLNLTVKDNLTVQDNVTVGGVSTFNGIAAFNGFVNMDNSSTQVSAGNLRINGLRSTEITLSTSPGAANADTTLYNVFRMNYSSNGAGIQLTGTPKDGSIVILVSQNDTNSFTIRNTVRGSSAVTFHGGTCVLLVRAGSYWYVVGTHDNNW